MEKVSCEIIESVKNQFTKRGDVGFRKYGKTLMNNNEDDFLQHLKEELMDSVLYIQKLQTRKLERNVITEEMVENAISLHGKNITTAKDIARVFNEITNEYKHGYK